MNKIRNLFLIGGNGRNIGKTTLATSLIKKLSQQGTVIGLKITSVYPGDEKYHGKKEIPLKNSFQVFEEFDRKGQKDTSKMLIAGAQKVYFIQVKDDSLSSIAHLIEKISNEYDYIVCESSSIRRVLIPNQFILVKNPANPEKQSITDIEQFADTILISQDSRMTSINNYVNNFTI
ncbi:MAG: hypothetical protein JEZ03_07465 [Bacteroidales bacterium]|nr:hypothetical protein [Bacteroidales bacterium]